MGVTIRKMDERRKPSINTFFRLGTLGVSLLFLACTMTPIRNISPEQEARNHLEMGVAFLKSRAYTPALEEFLAAEKQNPKNPEIYYYQGIAYYGKGMADKALEAFRRAVRLRPDYSEAWNYLGTLYLESQDYDEAIDSYNKALKNILFRNPGTSLYNLGIAYSRKGDFQKSIQAFEEAIHREPNSVLTPLIYKSMGVSSMKAKEYGKALEALQKSIELSPYIAESHYWLGLSYLETGRRESGEKALEMAASLGEDTEYGLLARKKLAELSLNR